MATAKLSKLFRTLARGLITEAPVLQFPEDATYDELNFILKRNGARHKREGLEPESGAALITTIPDPVEYEVDGANVSDAWVNAYEWKNAGNIGDNTFTVVAQHGQLAFFQNSSTNLSGGFDPAYLVDLTTYKVDSSLALADVPVQFASGRGRLYVVHPSIEILRINYEDGVGISVDTRTIEVRDLGGIETTLTNLEHPTSLTQEHYYNLRNQGWIADNARIRRGSSDPVLKYFSILGEYPSLSEIVHLLVRTASNKPQNVGLFDPRFRGDTAFGNNRAPRGLYIVNAFTFNRSAVSGLSVASEPTTERPRAVAFMAGRVFFAGVNSKRWANQVFFSKLITEDDDDEKMYQEGDPTAEIDNPLVATDGGTISIPEMGVVKTMVTVNNSVVIWAENGVWAISGPSGFRADDFEVRQISEVGTLSPLSVITADGVPFYWSDGGIYALTTDKISGYLDEENITQDTIQTFYNEQIPVASKLRAQAKYDSTEKRVYWLYNYNSKAGHAYHVYNACLTMDLKTLAFAPWTFEVPNDGADEAYVGCLASLSGVQRIASLVDVRSGTGNVDDVLAGDSNENDVQVTRYTTSLTAPGIKFYLMRSQTSPAYETVWGQTSDIDFADFADLITDQVDNLYEAYLEAGFMIEDDVMRDKSFQYVMPVFKRTEDAWTVGGATTELAHWEIESEFSGGPSSTLVDTGTSGNNLNLPLSTGSYAGESGTAPVGQTYSMDNNGGARYGELTNALLNDLPENDFTLEFYYRFPSIPTEWEQHLMGTKTSPTSDGWRIFHGEGNLMQFNVRTQGDSGTGDTFMTGLTGALATDTWHKFRFEWDASAFTGVWYVNDVAVTTNETPGGGANPSPVAHSTSFKLGQIPGQVMSSSNVYIDDVTITATTAGDFEWDRPSCVKMRSKWDFHNGAGGGKWSPQEDAYRFPLRGWTYAGTAGNYDGGEGVVKTKLRVRGSGRASQLRFDVTPGCDCQLLGWQPIMDATTDV